MNEKFFDLKKEKQDRILNAALKVFARNGYRRASTDEMVREAGISKGLLFHYFGTKAALYEFVCRYAVKYVGMELSGMLSGEQADYFLLKKQIEAVKYQISRSFPYMALFLQDMMLEKDADCGMEDALLASVREVQAQYRALMEGALAPADFSACAAYLEPDRLRKLTDYIIRGVMSEQYHGEQTPPPEAVYEQTVSLLTMLSELCRR